MVSSAEPACVGWRWREIAICALRITADDQSDLVLLGGQSYEIYVTGVNFCFRGGNSNFCHSTLIYECCRRGYSFLKSRQEPANMQAIH